MLVNCLFGAVSLTKIADIDKYNILDMELDLIEKEIVHLRWWIWLQFNNF